MVAQQPFLGRALRAAAIKSARSVATVRTGVSTGKDTLVTTLRALHFGVVKAVERVDSVPGAQLRNPSPFTRTRKLPLPQTKVCTFLGTWPFKVGSQPAIVRRTTKSLFKWWSSPAGAPYRATCPDPRNYFLVNGSWAANMHVLRAFATPSDATVTRAELLRCLSFVHTLNIPFMRNPNRVDLDNVQITPTTYPGFITRAVMSHLFGKKSVSKGAVLLACARAAHWLDERIRVDGFLGVTPMACGGREKLNNIDSHIMSHKDLKSRLVLMPELISELVQMAWSQMFTVVVYAASTPFTWGHRMTSGGWTKVFDPFIGCETILEGDFRGWDSTISEDHIVVALSLLRMCWPDSKRADNMFLFAAANLIHKIVITPGSYLFRVSKGIPSGSCWTSIVGSVIDWMIWVDVILHNPQFRAAGVKVKDAVFRIGIDDFLVGFRQPLDFDWELVRQWINARHGVELKAGFGPKILFADRPEDCASFYKVVLYRGAPDIRPADFWEQLVVPGTTLTATFEYISYLSARLQSPPGASAMVGMLASIFAFVQAMRADISPWFDEPYAQWHLWDHSWGASEEFSVAVDRWCSTHYDHSRRIAAELRWAQWLRRKWANIFIDDDGRLASSTQARTSACDTLRRAAFLQTPLSIKQARYLYSASYVKRSDTVRHCGWRENNILGARGGINMDTQGHGVRLIRRPPAYPPG
jgi:hypothetical protein